MTSLERPDQVPSGSPSAPRLVVLRGNSASGKSTVAQTLRAAYGRGLAIIPQDVVRRDILRERDRPGAVNVELINLMARHSLSYGFHVVLEGIFYVAHYGDMLTRLIRDHPGVAHCYYFDIPFQTTLERHATKPVAKVVGEAELRQWWRPRDLLPGGVEEIVDEHSSLDQTVARILKDSGLAPRENRV
ncbi:AAA family ATPase [Nocardiopsis alborubida]|uniref:Kinase n=1 Tax=Nocardiopsis alborubida TaxID=146802 RepID=A0A7X6M9S1_9ACTN|nr:AAA family ATPase [Nocardiopsis alborubida]NKY96604.1 kinase [Nocardiopsis alborubida]